jgi:predicted transporter
VGFVLISGGLIIGFTAIQGTKYIAYISAGSGILMEFIAGVFFYLYNRTIRQLKDYHDSLIAVQNILLSFKIVGDTKDQAKQASLMELMLKCLIKVPNNQLHPNT